MKTQLLVALLLVLLVSMAHAADEPAKLDTSLRRVAVFRNGISFAVRDGALPVRSGEVEISPLPVASEGTFWLAWSEGVRPGQIVSRPVTVTESRYARSVIELLAANIGKPVTLYLQGEEEERVEGTLLATPMVERPEILSPHLVQPVRPVVGEELVLVQTRQGAVGVPPSRVLRVSIRADEPQLTVADKSMRLGLFAEVQQAPADARVAVNYVSRGVSWTPSYLVDISDEETGAISAKALVRNDMEALEGVELFVVSGYPHLPGATSISPLTQYSSLLNLLTQQVWRGTGYGGPQGPAGPAGPAGARQVEYLKSDVYDLSVAYGEAAEVAVAEDLQYYPLGEVTLPLASTGYFPMFTADLPYEHVFGWDIPDYTDDSDHYIPPKETQEPDEIIWHCLRLTNQMDYAWPTGSAEVVQDGRVLGQGTLPHTASGAKSLLKFAQARDIEARELELEVDRQRKAAVFNRRDYDLVTVHGRLSLTSHRDSPTPLEIAKILTGEVQEMSPEARREQLAAKLSGVNPRSRLTWVLTLPPGETLEISYTFTIYVPA